ncbi:hypothetical protein AABB24_012782 [Solanum stoloniferum]|uniref:UBC core domain-containing protein n=1 Tax=Solanum stoloniferum TaxID=62892 RepID=A0ABD2U4T3_9SOLN
MEGTPAVTKIKELRKQWTRETIHTPWEQGKYEMTMYFDEEFPDTPPRCKFSEGFFHPNVYPSGLICIDILDKDRGWDSDKTIKEILEAIQNLLDSPNGNDPANEEAYYLFLEDQLVYENRVREQAKHNN